MGDPFTISSTENKFINVGCDTYGYLNSFLKNSSTVYSTGCLTRYYTFPREMYAKNCSGIGCCQVDVPVGMRDITFEAYGFKNHMDISEFNNYSYAFVVKKDWTRSGYACTNNTDCVDSPDGFGYNCWCKQGFDGNPYHPMDVMRNLIKQKEHFFRQNGGLILEQRLFAEEASSQTGKIFTTQELKKASNNYHDSLIFGKGGYGIVYKGFLPDNKVIAVKKSKLVDQNQIEEFINEVGILSQINHKNVVKLLGCCLKIEIPLLVYEFVSNGTLYDFIHNQERSSGALFDERSRRLALQERSGRELGLFQSAREGALRKSARKTLFRSAHE
ncbi:wall-associated receptor kinase 2-like [Prosopis cineraria]|uniref:wall-associated receptor kinase 2-like n=1 Tax=Prosopis cineraria TaxID=364024 RepID=UPI0024106A02|nr:wall-associated receptor kinase 2-like [Prosopis cineraria]